MLTLSSSSGTSPAHNAHPGITIVVLILLPDPPAILLVNFFLEKYLPLLAMDTPLCATVEGFFPKTTLDARQLTDMLVCNTFITTLITWPLK